MKQAQQRVVVIVGKAWVNGRQQHAENHRGEVGLDTKPGNRNHRSDQRWHLRAVDAKAYPADHRERHPGFLPHIARQVHEEKHQRRANAQRQQNLPAAQAHGIQPDRKGIVGDVVHIVGPQRKDAVAAPAPAFGLGGGQILVVQAWAEFWRGGAERRRGQGRGGGQIQCEGVQACTHSGRLHSLPEKYAKAKVYVCFLLIVYKVVSTLSHMRARFLSINGLCNFVLIGFFVTC